MYTPPVKAATTLPYWSTAAGVFQSTPPVKAATDIQIFAVYRVGISIHAAREGGDRFRRIFKSC